MLEWDAAEFATAAVAVVFVLVVLFSWGVGYDGSGSRNNMKTVMMVTMATTPIANFIMNHTSCVTPRS